MLILLLFSYNMSIIISALLLFLDLIEVNKLNITIVFLLVGIKNIFRVLEKHFYSEICADCAQITSDSTASICIANVFKSSNNNDKFFTIKTIAYRFGLLLFWH